MQILQAVFPQTREAFRGCLNYFNRKQRHGSRKACFATFAVIYSIGDLYSN